MVGGGGGGGDSWLEGRGFEKSNFELGVGVGWGGRGIGGIVGWEGGGMKKANLTG